MNKPTTSPEDGAGDELGPPTYDVPDARKDQAVVDQVLCLPSPSCTKRQAWPAPRALTGRL